MSCLGSGQGGQEGESKLHHVDFEVILALFLDMNAKAARMFPGRRIARE